MDRDLKRVLRKSVREAVAKCPADALMSESEIVMCRLESLPEFQNAKVVALYWSLPDELRTHKFIEKWSGKKIILLPVVEGDSMSFHTFSSPQSMRSGSFNILEPTQSESEPSVIDLIVVPGVAFDRQGHRLGRGRGYYDKFLCNRAIFKVGVCLSAQFFDSIPYEDHDITMDIVLTPSHSLTAF